MRHNTKETKGNQQKVRLIVTIPYYIIMLSGIKTGKKKKKKSSKRKDPPPSADAADEVPPHNSGGGGGVIVDEPSSRKTTTTTTTTKAASSSKSNNNALIAQMLRQQMEDGQAPERSSSSSEVVVILPSHHNPAVAAAVAAAAAANKKDPSELTVQEMLAQEMSGSGSGRGGNMKMSQSELEARNVLRLDKRRKLKKNEDSDEEEERYARHVLGRQGKDSSKEKVQANAVRRLQHRQLAQHDRQDRIISKCWWWIESPSFASHLLISCGQSVALMATPANRSLYTLSEKTIKHFYMVPIPHAESLVNCDDENNTVWNEIRQYQSSLSNMFHNKDDKKYKLLYYETVLPTSSSSSSQSSFWQTRLEAVAVPQKVWNEAPFYFKSALEAVAQDWGTHQKLMKTTSQKPLTRTVPKNFSYFYVEYDSDNRSGFVQMIENSGNQQFQSDFGIDTVAGMMEMDPVRFKRKQKTNVAAEKRAVQDFQMKFRPYDWTTTTNATT